MGAVVLMTVGGLFLLENFHVNDLDFNHTWPLLLISIGVVKMLQRSASTEGHVQPPVAGAPFPMPPAQPMPPVSTAMVPSMPTSMPDPQSSQSSSEVRHE
jgi:hypothetical protein